MNLTHKWRSDRPCQHAPRYDAASQYSGKRSSKGHTEGGETHQSPSPTYSTPHFADVATRPITACNVTLPPRRRHHEPPNIAMKKRSFKDQTEGGEPVPMSHLMLSPLRCLAHDTSIANEATNVHLTARPRLSEHGGTPTDEGGSPVLTPPPLL
ncbi:hypothetical protein BC834DRAFT_974105 [Gloeopeniophorella convolvens]|nr:hypothetical protein BC834DRAFT_974105 [Gloeopeniophorella convolvens]